MRLRFFDPHSNVLPHTSCSSYSSSPPPLLSLVRGPRQHHYLPFTPSLLPPCEFSANPRRLAGSLYVFLPLPPVSCSSVHKERVHAAVKVAVVPSGLRWELLSSFFKSTHPRNSSYTQNSALKMQICCFWWISAAPQTQDRQDRLVTN